MRISIKFMKGLCLIIALMLLINHASAALYTNADISNNSINNNDIVLGNKDAKVIVIEYSSPTCSYCRQYHLKVFSEIKCKYIDTKR